jgi:hypothetical protein
MEHSDSIPEDSNDGITHLGLWNRNSSLNGSRSLPEYCVFQDTTHDGQRPGTQQSQVDIKIFHVKMQQTHSNIHRTLFICSLVKNVINSDNTGSNDGII